MEQLHHWIFRHRKRLWWTFLLLSIVFLILNVLFGQAAGQAICLDAFGENRVEAQYFTNGLTFGPIDLERWADWRGCILDLPRLRSLYYAVFGFDNVWAFFLVLGAYAFAFRKRTEFNTRGAWLMGILALAYVSDFTENTVYITLAEENWWVRRLPLIGSLKLILYVAGLAFAPLVGRKTVSGQTTN